MTETEQKTCTCAEPHHLVRTTRHTADSKVQYLRCKKCGLPAGQKRVESVLAQRIRALELIVYEIRRRL
jgi:Pyruvate/2-oxoacid:ferredoxin oxidoreductase delta subunit